MPIAVQHEEIRKIEFVIHNSGHQIFVERFGSNYGAKAEQEPYFPLQESTLMLILQNKFRISTAAKKKRGSSRQASFLIKFSVLAKSHLRSIYLLKMSKVPLAQVHTSNASLKEAAQYGPGLVGLFGRAYLLVVKPK